MAQHCLQSQMRVKRFGRWTTIRWAWEFGIAVGVGRSVGDRLVVSQTPPTVSGTKSPAISQSTVSQMLSACSCP